MMFVSLYGVWEQSFKREPTEELTKLSKRTQGLEGRVGDIWIHRHSDEVGREMEIHFTMNMWSMKEVHTGC